MRPESYARLAAVEDHHWWYLGMRATARGLLGDAPLGDLLDAGCGTGGWLDALAAARKPPAAEGQSADSRAPVESGLRVALDLSGYALKAARQRGVDTLVQASVTSLPFPDSAFHTVTSLDVVYHLDVGSDLAALSEFHRVLAPNGRLLIQVPAFDWLQSRHDREVHTRERYSANTLRTRLESSGFSVDRLTYANALLFPVAAMWRTLERFLPPGPAQDLVVPPWPLNALGEAVLGIERWLLGVADLPFGLSVIALARRSPLPVLDPLEAAG